MGVVPFQCKRLGREARGDEDSEEDYEHLAWDTCTSGAQRRWDRAIGPYDRIICGKTSKKVVTVKFGGFQGGADRHKFS